MNVGENTLRFIEHHEHVFEVEALEGGIIQHMNANHADALRTDHPTGLPAKPTTEFP